MTCRSSLSERYLLGVKMNLSHAHETRFRYSHVNMGVSHPYTPGLEALTAQSQCIMLKDSNLKIVITHPCKSSFPQVLYVFTFTTDLLNCVCNNIVLFLLITHSLSPFGLCLALMVSWGFELGGACVPDIASNESFNKNNSFSNLVHCIKMVWAQEYWTVVCQVKMTNTYSGLHLYINHSGGSRGPQPKVIIIGNGWKVFWAPTL